MDLQEQVRSSSASAGAWKRLHQAQVSAAGWTSAAWGSVDLWICGSTPAQAGAGASRLMFWLDHKLLKSEFLMVLTLRLEDYLL